MAVIIYVLIGNGNYMQNEMQHRPDFNYITGIVVNKIYSRALLGCIPLFDHHKLRYPATLYQVEEDGGKEYRVGWIGYNDGPEYPNIGDRVEIEMQKSLSIPLPISWPFGRPTIGIHNWRLYEELCGMVILERAESDSESPKPNASQITHF